MNPSSESKFNSAESNYDPKNISSLDLVNYNQFFPLQWKIPLQFTVEIKITPTALSISNIKSNGIANKELQPESITEGIDAPLDYSNREGYKVNFLGDEDKFKVSLPILSGLLERDAAPIKVLSGSPTSYELKYQHFSVVMNKKRRLPFFTAVNIDGNQLRRIPRGGDKWYIDPRIERQYQFGNELYTNNDLDRGHMVRRLDPVWGETAAIANEDTFHFTNACPQHKDLNQKTWNDLEDYILDNAGAHNLKVSVFTGPVFRHDDIPYRNAKIPREFWKVAVLIDPQSGNLSATAYLLSQADMINNLEFAFGPFRTYQIPLAQVESFTDLNFGNLRNFDPIGNATTEGLQIKVIERPKDILFR